MAPTHSGSCQYLHCPLALLVMLNCFSLTWFSDPFSHWLAINTAYTLLVVLGTVYCISFMWGIWGYQQNLSVPNISYSGLISGYNLKLTSEAAPVLFVIFNMLPNIYKIWKQSKYGIKSNLNILIDHWHIRIQPSGNFQNISFATTRSILWNGILFPKN